MTSPYTSWKTLRCTTGERKNRETLWMTSTVPGENKIHGAKDSVEHSESPCGPPKEMLGTLFLKSHIYRGLPWHTVRCAAGIYELPPSYF